ncbi:MAG: nucleoside-diphosphate-sugar epimerase [Candidatus Nanohaloarchaea archaeon]|jgi:nucleoside-diphosphate-sugar epimerase
MEIFITGGTGFVGSHLIQKLSRNHEITVGGLTPEKSILELPEEVNRKRIDVTKKDSLDFSGYDCVIHLVALSPLKKPAVPYRKIHVEGTRNVVDQSEQDRVEKFFHMSALGADKNARTQYLRTKGEAEEYVKKSDLDWRIMKPSTMFGEGGEFLDFISKLTTPYLTVLPGKNTRFQPVHIDDAVRCIEESLKDDYSDKIFEIGGPEKLSLAEIAEMIDNSRGRNLEVLDLPMPLFRLSMSFSERIPISPFGKEQYYSLKTDNVTEDNDVEDLGMKISEMKTLDEYLELK